MSEIKWTKCSEEMPPDDDTQVIIRTTKDHILLRKDSARCVRCYMLPIQYEWTPYTPEAWEELNR